MKRRACSSCRRANGYRDYSGGDAETLEKIALLRRLGMSIEDIRRVQDYIFPLAVDGTGG